MRCHSHRVCYLPLLLLSGLAACSGASRPRSTPPPNQEPDAALAAPAAGSSVIHDGGVGLVRLGAPLPAVLLGDDAETRHVARFIADGQPLEAFRLRAPPVLAAFSGGIATDLQPPPGAEREAVRRARAGKLIVTAVHIEDPEPRTALGAGVGSTLAELSAAHGGVKNHPVPPTWGGDECAATVPGLDRVVFYFATCAAAESGAGVVRVIVFDPSN